MTEKVIIIGSGPAGWAAAIYAARANLKPILFEGSPYSQLGASPLGQLNQTTEVENYPGFPSGVLDQYLDSVLPEVERLSLPPTHEPKHAVTGPELMHLMRQQARNFGTRIITDDVVDVKLGSHPFVLETAENGRFTTETVILATGASANYLGLESENIYKNRGVSACAVCDGALPLFRDKPLVVVGGGDSAVEEATYLTNFGSKVYMVHRRDQLRASKIMADRALTNPKIEMVWNSGIEEVLGDGKRVTGVRVKNLVSGASSEIACSGMFVAIGHTPNTAFLKGQVELTDKKYIKLTTPFRTYTSVDGVFAAGDVADDYYRQAITSAGTGCMAALDAERWLASKGH